ncbi:hypothetical protein GGS20DRAFT_500727 [Poronia punctata]|nr:hypothetical protein GGS20DRAFT_500727 [Poronia punctata]
MPTTRQASRSSSSNRQATLSFNHRVTKSVPKSAKSSTPTEQSPLVKNVTYPEPPSKEEVESEVDEKKAEPQLEPERKKTEAELRAAKITDRQINQYWHKLERERRTKRVHQEGLTMAEKILRLWDVSNQYGPCVGMTRLKRWERAERLGLHPPAEVLAVLMREEEKGTKGIERAHMDDILNSTAVGSG